MKIKTKLTLGVGLLFLMIILLALVGGKYINALKNDTESILVANYNTLEYSRNMMLALDETVSKQDAFTAFEENLKKQQQNITEMGEKEATQRLADHFNELKKNPQDSLLHPLIRKDISEIMKLNMEAIDRKSNIAKETAQTATLWIAITGTVCFLIAFILLVNLPSTIANPIKELTESIKQIAAKNYDQRVNFEGHDEFGELAEAFNSMALKLNEYENSNLDKLMEERRRIITIINNLRDPLIALNENRNILLINTEACKVIGLEEKSVINKYAPDIALTNDLMRTLLNNDNAAKPLKIFADNKESYFTKEVLEVTGKNIVDGSLQKTGEIIFLKNITHFQELDTAKTNFIATVSHELKTPISSIKMSLQLLEDKRIGDTNEEQKQLMQNIKEDSERLLKITSELLNMAQVETGKIQINIKPTEPKEIVEYAIEAIRFPAEQKHLTIEVKYDENLSFVNADTEKTAWVLINFLSNAIRYSPENNKIIIEAIGKNNAVEFSVKDFGKGIDPIYKDKIFDRYFRVPGSSKTGTGLGLTISKEFIEAQGGKIWVESELGEGSKFIFILSTESLVHSH